MPTISWLALSTLFIPLGIVIFIYHQWTSKGTTLLYATARMVSQLIIIGYCLRLIFDQSSTLITCSILLTMLLIAAWISLRPLHDKNSKLYLKALVSMSLGTLPILFLVVTVVLRTDEWDNPRFIIPLAGMIFANSMTTISLAGERFLSEYKRTSNAKEALHVGFGASLIPITNSFFAVGLVSLPGMMTGQILAGASPLIAVRYQIMVMAMFMGASGISTALFLRYLMKSK